MYAQAIAGYPNNTWNTAYPYSNMNYQNNATNINNGGINTSIFGNSSNVVNHVPYDSIMTAPFGAQQMSYVPTYAPQQQSTDYTGKVMDMLMSMCMMMFQKKLNEDNNQKTETPKVVIEDDKNEMNDVKAAKILMNNFDKIEVIDDPKADNVATWTEMGKYYAQTTDDEYKKAYEYFQSNQDVFTYIETLMGKENADWKNPDNQVNKRELVEFISSKSE